MTYKHKITGTQAKLGSDGKYYIHNCSIGIPKQLIENSKVWVKEDGYEILSFYSGCKGAPFAYIFEKLPNGLYSKGTGDCTLEHGLTYWKIFSVKRISDGEVFSIGDKVKFSKDYKGFKIEKISLRDNRLELYGDGLFCSVVESNVYKLLPVILTTEDGVDIFDVGEFVWDTSDTNWDYLGSTPAGVMKAIIPKSKRKAWAKKENAEKYIKENKPQYSLNDIRNILTKQMEDNWWVMVDVDKVIKDLEK